MSTITSVDTIVVAVKDVVEDVTVTKAEGRSARVEVEPEVVRVGDGYGGILRTVAVRVTDQGSFPVGVELAIGDTNTGASVGDIEETIVAKGYLFSTVDVLKKYTELTSLYHGPCRLRGRRGQSRLGERLEYQEHHQHQPGLWKS